MEIHLVPSKGQPQAPLKAQDVVSDDSKTAGSSLFISGTQRLDYAERDVGRGIPVFRDVDIYRYPPERDLSYEELIKVMMRKLIVYQLIYYYLIDHRVIV